MHRLLLTQKGEAFEPSRESLLVEDSLRSGTDTTTDCPDSNSLSNDTGLETSLNSKQPVITLTRLKIEGDDQQQENEAEPSLTSQDLNSSGSSSDGTEQDLSLHNQAEEATSQESVAQESLGELPAGSREEPGSELAAADDDKELDEERESPAVPGRKNSTGKAKATPKRRSGRAMNRR